MGSGSGRDKPDSGSAAAQFRSVSAAVRALATDPEKAHGQAIKTVESAAHAVVEPANPRATLGTICGVMRARPGSFEVIIPSAGGARCWVLARRRIVG